MNTSSLTKADSPLQLTWSDGWRVLKQVVRNYGQDQIQLLAAGVAFYFLLALFPMITAIVSVYGIMFGPMEASQHTLYLQGMVPREFLELIETHIGNIVTKSDSTLSLGAIISSALALWSGSKGIQALIKACNVAYQEHDGRHWWKGLLVRIAFTAAALALVLVALALIAVLPVWMGKLGMADLITTFLPYVVWPLFALGFSGALIMLFRFAPHRRSAKWRWLSIGTLFSTALWMLASAGFSYYVANFASYNQSYGSLGGVIILLMWFYITAVIILLGAELNSAIEHHTQRDTTVGQARPVGQRGAVVADTYPDND